MTKKELFEKLAQVPDDTEIFVCDNHDKCEDILDVDISEYEDFPWDVYLLF